MLPPWVSNLQSCCRSRNPRKRGAVKESLGQALKQLENLLKRAPKAPSFRELWGLVRGVMTRRGLN